MTQTDAPYPPPQLRFGVEIDGVVAGWFTECSGLTIERAVTPHREGGVNDYVHQLPGRVTRSKITLKRGLIDNALWDWFETGLYDAKVTSHNISVILYHPDRTEAARWDLLNAYPTRWSVSDFKAETAQILLETLELTQTGAGSADAPVQLARSTAGKNNPAESVSTQTIDIPALAQAVYRLMQQELRLEQHRLGRR